MSDQVAVVVGTYGDFTHWGPLAEVAIESAWKAGASDVVSYHGYSLADARNGGAQMTTAEWLVFLDADDTLDEGYVEGVLNGVGDLRQPKTIGVYPDGRVDSEAVLIPTKPTFRHGNWLVVGTAVRRHFFDLAGGWGEEALYEDWALWIRCWLAGAEIGTAPEAIYRVHVNPEGRNLPDRDTQAEWFRQIEETYRPIAQSKGLPW